MGGGENQSPESITNLKDRQATVEAEGRWRHGLQRRESVDHAASVETQPRARDVNCRRNGGRKVCETISTIISTTPHTICSGAIPFAGGVFSIDNLTAVSPPQLSTVAADQRVNQTLQRRRLPRCKFVCLGGVSIQVREQERRRNRF